MRVVYTYIAPSKNGETKTQFVRDDAGNWRARHVKNGRNSTHQTWTKWKQIPAAILPPLELCKLSHMNVYITK